MAKRVIKACNFCRKRHLRCDGNEVCYQCQFRDLECVYDGRTNPSLKKEVDDAQNKFFFFFFLLICRGGFRDYNPLPVLRAKISLECVAACYFNYNEVHAQKYWRKIMMKEYGSGEDMLTLVNICIYSGLFAVGLFLFFVLIF